MMMMTTTTTTTNDDDTQQQLQREKGVMYNVEGKNSEGKSIGGRWCTFHQLLCTYVTVIDDPLPCVLCFNHLTRGRVRRLPS